MAAPTASNQGAIASQADAPSIITFSQSQSQSRMELPIHDWLHRPDPSFQARMVQTQQTLPSNGGQIAMSDANKMGQIDNTSPSLLLSDRTYTNTNTSRKQPSISGVSNSYAPSTSYAPSESSSSQVPSLTNTGTTESSAYSVSTGLASAVSGIPYLEPGEEQLRPPRAPRFECAFHFLDCEFASDDFSEWKVHCLAHFHPHEPPKKVSCPFCEFTGSFKSGREAWEARLKHVSLHHAAGYSIASGRPDFELYEYLKNRRIIEDGVYKDLMMSGEADDGSEAVATTTYSERDERRRRRRRV